MIGCEKNNATPDKIDKDVLSGKWVNTQLSADTLFFFNDSIIMRTDTITHLPKHRYKYKLEEDSITLKYTGEYYIFVPESTFKICKSF